MNSVKRLLIAALAISLLVFVFSCENKAPHVHTFSENWTSDSTHHWHIPTCDDTNEVDGKAEHKFGEGKVTKEATVDAEGERTYTCSVCGYEKKEVIEKHKHVFSTEWTSDDNCHWHATECGHTDAEEKIKHTYNEGVVSKEATATEEGEKTYTCTACGKKNIVKTGTSAHVHSYKEKLSSDKTYHWYEPTCEHKTEIKDKAEHSFGEGVTVEATCTEDGKTTYKCTSCDYSYSVTIPKKGHSFADSWSSDDAYHWHAATCEHSNAETKEKHTNKLTVNTPATCVKEGNATSTCSICNKSVETTIDKNANNHPEESLSWRYDSYLTKKSYKAQFCSACNKFTGKTKDAEEGVEPLTGYWRCEEFDYNGYRCFEILSFDDAKKEYVIENYIEYNDKTVLMEMEDFGKCDLVRDETTSSPIVKIELGPGDEIADDEDGASTSGGGITYYTYVREEVGHNGIICYQKENEDGVEGEPLEGKFIKISDTPHAKHTMESDISETDYFNIDENYYYHYVPTACTEHETFYYPEKHTYDEGTTSYKCTKCGVVKPWDIQFCAISKDNTYTGGIIKYIDRSEKTFKTTERFEMTYYDGTTYEFTGIKSWHTGTVGSTDSYKEYNTGEEIKLSDDLYIYFTYENVTPSFPTSE